MRLKASLFALVAVSAAMSAVLLDVGTSAAINCPPGTQVHYVTTPLGTRHGVCVPYQQCDPGPCDPTAAPNRD